MDTPVIYERQDEIGIIKLNRPKVLNAVSDDLLHHLLATLQTAQNDEKTAVVILKGEGRAFCSGADLNEAAARKGVDEEYRHISLMQKVGYTMLIFDKPMIAAVQGYALGAGCEIALLCDMRVTAEGSKWGFPEASVGGIVTTAGTQLLPRLIGLGRAKEMILTSVMIDAKQAEQWGLVNKVVPPEELDKVTMELAKALAQQPARALKTLRLLINRNMDSDYVAALELEQLAACYSFASGENQANIQKALQRIRSK